MGIAEQWLPVAGWESSYEVSNHGRVRSVRRNTYRRDGAVCPVGGKVLSPTGKKRPQVKLYSGHREYIFRQIHILVLEAFVGPRPLGMFGLHADDNPHNNHLNNLRWGTPSENTADAIRNGKHPAAQQKTKTNCPQGHEYTEQNTRLWGNYRYCRACSKERASKLTLKGA